MPSTYTTNLGIEKIGIGEQAGGWGTTTNTNFDIIDQAVGGVHTETLVSAASSGTPNTLPITDGVLSDGRNIFVEFNDGGDLGGTAYVQLTPSDAEKIMYVRNSLSNSRDIALFQGTYNVARAITVPNGKDILVKFNGAGASATVSYLQPNEYKVADVDISGSLSVDNIDIDGNTISSTDTNGNIILDANGTGVIQANDDISMNGKNILLGDSASSSDDRVVLGADQDLEIYHTGTNAYISNDTGELLVQGDGITLQSVTGTESYLTADLDGAVTLYYDSSAKIATSSSGATLTGTLVADGVTLGDDEYIKIGAGEDLQLYHSSNESYIKDNTSLGLSVLTDAFTMKDTNNSETLMTAALNGAVTLYYDNTARVATTSSGAAVTGRIKSTSYSETVGTLTGTTPTVDLSTATVFTHTMSGNTTYSFSNPPSTGTALGFVMKITQGASAYTIGWPASVRWNSGVAPTVPGAGETDVYVFFTHDGGTNYYGFQVGNNMS